jgi:RHS repeat-associated protein
MGRVIHIIFLILFGQFIIAQEETIQLEYDISGYDTSISTDLHRFDSSSLDTIPSVKGDMNVNELGGLTYMLPIEVLKGVNNFQPNLALGYNSQSGNGQAGWGWNIIGLSTITQGGKSQYIDGITIGKQFNSQDPFYLDGQRIIETSPSVFETEKYSKIKIQKYSNTSEFSFIIKYTDGKIAKYKEILPGQHYISKLIDAIDNEVHYSYLISNNVPILTSVSYGSNSVNNDKFFINFIYNDRAVPIKSYRNGDQYISNKVLSSIEVTSTYITLNNGLYRKYNLTHDYIQGNTVERLIKIEVENENGISLKPLQFGYNTSTSGTILTKGLGNYFPSSLWVVGEGLRFVKELGSVAVGDFFGNGDVTTIFEVKYSNNKYSIFNSKSRSFIEGGYTESKNLYVGRALFNNKISENEVLIYSHTEYINDSTNPNLASSLVDIMTFKVRSLSPAQEKTITLNLQGGLNIIEPTGFGFHERDKEERKTISGDFNNDGLFDIIIIEHSTTTRTQKIYFFEIGKSEGGNFTPTEVTGSTINSNNNFYQIEFNGDGIPEILAVDKNNGDFGVYKFNYVNKTLNIIPNILNNLPNFTENTPLFFGDYNGDGLTDFITPHKIYDIEGSTVTLELSKINSEIHLWWEYISTGTNFIKTQKNYTEQKLAYFKTSQRNIIKKSSDWEKFWNGQPDSYQFTEYGTSTIIPVDFNNDGKTDLVSVNCFGNVKYDVNGDINRTQIQPGNPFADNNKIVFLENKTLSNGSQTFNNIGNRSISSLTPLSLIMNYNDFNHLNSYKSGIRIYDIMLERDYSVTVNNDNFLEGQISIVNNGSPVRQIIEYKPMIEKNNDYQDDTYSTKNLNLNYPYFVNKNLGVSYIVSKMHTVFDENIITKEYRYENAVQSLNGKGLLGFQRTIISDPYESILIDGKYKMKDLFTAHFWRINTYNSQHDNALISTTYGSLNTNSIFTKSQLTNQRFDKGNHRYQILTTIEVNTDYLKDIVISKTYNYDTAGDLLLNQLNTNYNSQGSSIEKFTYSPEFNNNEHYFFGKISKRENITFRGSDSFETKEEQAYNTNGTVESLSKYGNNTSPIITNFTYYPFGEIETQTVSTVGISPMTTSYEYDATNRFLAKTISPDLLESVVNINPIGRVLFEISPLGHTTSYKYDNWGNVKEITDYLGKKTRITKNITPSEPLGYYSISQKREGGIETITVFDIFDKAIKTKQKSLNDQWLIKEKEYDIFGKAIKESEPYYEGETVLWHTTEYDYLDRPTKTTTASGKEILTCYEGLKVTVEDGHKKTSKWIDAMGLVVKVKDAGGELFYKYFPNGSLKETNYDGIKTKIEIDGWGNKTKLIDPSAGTYLYEYDNFSRIKKETNPKGGITEYTYDEFGKLISENTNSPTENTIINKTYSYDANTQLPTVVSGTYNNKNYTYTTYYNDPFFRVSGKKEQTPDFVYETTIDYDEFGRVDQTELKTTLNSPNHITISNVINNFDENGILTSQYNGQTESLIWEVNEINSRGLATQMEFGNGYTIQTDYNSNNFHLEKIKHFSDTQTLLEINYNYHNLKNVLNSRDNLTFSKNETYVYDDLDRLLEEAVNGVITQEYTFDKRGRMTSNTAVGKYNYNEQNYKLQSINFNENGANVNTTRGFAEIQYNSFKNPIEIFLPGKDRISYDYSILKTRSAAYYGSLSTTATERPNRKFYSADKAIEIIKEGNTTRIITYITGDPYSANYMKVDILNNGNLVSNDNYFLHRDNQGTILAISKADTNGTVIEKRYFDAWGNLKEAIIGTTTHIPNNLGWVDGLLFERGYTGHEHLKTVGLIHMNGRIYDPVLRRFLSPDNYVQEPHSTQSYNRFVYVYNNPLLYKDPSGELAFLAAVGIGVAVAIITNGISNSINGVPFWYGAGKAGMMGGISGAISFGIGSIATSTFSNAYSVAAFQAGMHATTGGMMSEIQGGSFASGFASGAISSMVSSGIGAIGDSGYYLDESYTQWSSFASRNPGMFKALMVSSGGLSGGVGSTIAGGNFWDGARQGLITSGLNHLAHEGLFSIEKRRDLLSRFKKNSNGRYIVDPYGKPNFSQEGVETLNSSVDGLQSDYELAGRPSVDFELIHPEYTGLAKPAPQSFRTNIL